MAQQHNSVREGIYAGIIGATAIAVWFAIIDFLGAHPLHTPDILGAGLISVLGKPPMMPDTMAFHVFIYTIFHYAVFAIVGIILATTTLIAVMSIINGMNQYIAKEVSDMGVDGFRVRRIIMIASLISPGVSPDSTSSSRRRRGRAASARASSRNLR